MRAVMIVPIIWFTFDTEPLTDAVQGAPMALVGGATLADSPPLDAALSTDFDSGSALALDGAGSWAEAASDTLYEPAYFTLSAWIHPTAIGDEKTILAKANTEENATGYWLILRDDDLRLTIGADDIEQEILGEAGIETDRWTHVAATFDGFTVKLYVDGALIEQETVTVPLIYGDEPFQVGHITPRDEFGFVGLIDEVRIYDGVLDEEEVADLIADYDVVEEGDTQDTGPGVEGDEGAAEAGCGCSTGAPVGWLWSSWLVALVAVRRRSPRVATTRAPLLELKPSK